MERIAVERQIPKIFRVYVTSYGVYTANGTCITRHVPASGRSRRRTNERTNERTFSAFSAFSAFSDLRDDARVTPRRTRTRRGVTARARHKKTNARRCVERAACAARVALGAQDRLVADPFADRAHTRNRARSGTTTRRRSLGNDHDTRRKKTHKKNRVVTTLARIFALLPRVERDADCA